MMFKAFPCDANKIPLVSDWQTMATKDPAQIAAWQAQFGERLAYFGIPTGPDNNLLVLDVDIKKENGFASLNGLELPPTLFQRTRSGGAHYFFQYPQDGQTYGNRAGFLPALDLRGLGGYVIWYGTDATSLPPAPAPQWLVQKAIKHSPKNALEGPQTSVRLSHDIVQAKLQECVQKVLEAESGAANNTLNAQAYVVGQMIATGSLSYEDGYKALYAAALQRGQSQFEAEHTILSGFKGGAANPITVAFDTNVQPAAALGIPTVPMPTRWTPERITKDDLYNVHFLRKPMIFKDWSARDITITTADGGTGKTTLALFEAVCMALGERFLGFDCKKPGGKTLFVTGEDDEPKLKAMLGQICKQMDILDDELKLGLVLSCIIIKKDSDMCIIQKDRASGMITMNLEAQKKVLQAVEDLGPIERIVFDPISSFWGSEAALNDMSRAVAKFMMELVQKGHCQVEAINHMGKASSSSKDMSQFAGRGGTGLPSNARISRVLRNVDEKEYREVTGEELPDGEKAMMCQVNKYSDNSPLLNKQFLIMRKGWLFYPKSLSTKAQVEAEAKQTDEERIFTFIKEVRTRKQYPTKRLVSAHFSQTADKISPKRVEFALEQLVYNGHLGDYLKITAHPDQLVKDKVYIITDEEGNE